MNFLWWLYFRPHQSQRGTFRVYPLSGSVIHHCCPSPPPSLLPSPDHFSGVLQCLPATLPALTLPPAHPPEILGISYTYYTLYYPVFLLNNHSDLLKIPPCHLLWWNRTCEAQCGLAIPSLSCFSWNQVPVPLSLTVLAPLHSFISLDSAYPLQSYTLCFNSSSLFGPLPLPFT